MQIFIALLSVAILVLLCLGIAHGWAHVSNRLLGRHGLVRKTFLTPNELDFYHLLKKAVEPRWTVIPQVAMGALMDTALTQKHPAYYTARARFSGKICDFVLCDPKTMVPQLVIELDDVMHNFKKDRIRDTMAARAGYRTLRFWSRNKPGLQELRQEIWRLMALNNPA